MLSSPERRRVLVVDDNANLADAIVEGVSEHGYHVVGATSGKEALRLLRSERVDALVTDLRMPGVDGLALLRASMTLDPLRPVIVMTAYGSIETAMDAVGGGSWHFLIKPFRVELLVQLLRAAFEARHGR